MNKTAFIRGLEDALGNYIEKSGSIPSFVKNQLKRKYPDAEFNKNIRTQWDYIVGKLAPIKRLKAYMKTSPEYRKHPMTVWRGVLLYTRNPENKAFRHYVREHPNKPITKEYLEAFKNDFIKKFLKTDRLKIKK